MKNSTTFNETHSKHPSGKAHGIIALLLLLCSPAFIFAQSVPGLEWAREYGTTASGFPDYSQDVVSCGNIYVCGYTNGIFPGQTNLGSSDAFVIKHDALGNFLWVKEFGTSGSETCPGIVADGSGVYVTGNTTGTFPGQSSAGSTDVYIRKLDHDGNELWTRQVGIAGVDRISDAIAVDASGVYFAGTTMGSFPGYVNPDGKRDVFLTKYSLNGDLIWIKQYTLAGDDYVMGAYDNLSGLYLAGYRGVGNQDGYVTKYSHDGDLIWSQTFGTSGTETVNEIAGDETGIYITGNTNSIFPGQSSAGSDDAFVVKYSSDGSQLWAREFGTDQKENATGVSVSTSGIYITGNTKGTFPGQPAALGNDIFVAKYNAAGNLMWIFETGAAAGPLGVPEDFPANIVVDGSHAYVTGYTSGVFPGQSIIGPAPDGFLLKMLVNNAPLAVCRNVSQMIMTETVQLDGSGSSDPDGDAISYAWSFEFLPPGSSAVFSDAGAVNPYFTGDLPGEYQVQLIVNDGTEDSDPCQITITFVTPQKATLELIAEVQGLVTSRILNAGQGNALIVKLQAAIHKMDQGNYNAAINNLAAFINQVNAFSNSGILPNVNASALIAEAERIITVLGSFLTKQGEFLAPGGLSSSAELTAWNSPNPFSVSTTITYSLPSELHVTVKVFNSRGMEVSFMDEGVQGTGPHTLTLSADGLSCGIYYYRIQAGSYSATIKLAVAR